ncbi:MAG: DinB family protein [Chloroflexi bacterium]|nr:DinB family protein [Chloroflexota bacterium]
MNAPAIKTMVDYHYGMYDRIWDIVQELSPQQFVAESDYSLGSLRNQLLHVIEVDNRWLARLQNLPLPDFLTESDFPDQAALRPTWDSIRADVLAYTDALTTNDLEEVVELDFPHRGGNYRNLRWQILLHVVNHGTDHRAQILARLHELGASTLEQDLILYLWSAED